MSDVILSAHKISKSFDQGTSSLHILKDVDFELKSGEALCIVGASGAGKSTFLHILGTLDRPSSGNVIFEGRSLFTMPDEELSLFRNEKMGFVFQFHHLLAEFTALENVMMPARIAGLSVEESKESAMKLLVQMGLESRKDHFPNQLSGGELQRTAIARALVRKPKILFADEPTGNLDSANGAIIQDLFFHLKETFGLALVVVTHDPNFAKKFGRVMRLADGHWV